MKIRIYHEKKFLKEWTPQEVLDMVYDKYVTRQEPFGADSSRCFYSKETTTGILRCSMGEMLYQSGISDMELRLSSCGIGAYTQLGHSQLEYSVQPWTTVLCENPEDEKFLMDTQKAHDLVARAPEDKKGREKLFLEKIKILAEKYNLTNPSTHKQKEKENASS